MFCPKFIPIWPRSHGLIYPCSLNYEEAHRKLSNDADIVLNWFRISSIVANSGKFQMFLGSSINNNNITIIAETLHKK